VEPSTVNNPAELTAGDVVHRKFSTLPATATVGEIRAWFDESSHRRMAFLADGDRYAGSLTREDVGAAADPERPAVELVRPLPTVAPGAPVREAYELAVQTGVRRVPVVDASGALLGVVAVTEDLERFCGTGVSTPMAGAPQPLDS
jgi:CBS domain-containing protein